MRDPYTSLPEPATLDPDRNAKPNQTGFDLKAVGYVEAEFSPAEIARRLRDGQTADTGS